MEALRIQGGIPLKGTFKINGAKNAALPMMVLSILTEEEVILHEVPNIKDVLCMEELLRSLGGEISKKGQTISLRVNAIANPKASKEHVGQMRASILVLGALVARYGRAKVSLPGGCAIGSRPVNFHLEGLKAFGVGIAVEEDYIIATAPDGIPGGSYTFPKPSVTGTQNLLFAAVLARGSCEIHNAALDPEITQVVFSLKAMGAVIEISETSLYIQGVSRLGAVTSAILPDRIEIGTAIIAAAITGGHLTLENASMKFLPGLHELLRDIGITVVESETSLEVFSQGALNPFHITTNPFPGFPTDLQAQFMALATCIPGTSSIRETIWENRFMHVPELNRMGAKIDVQGDKAIITGVDGLTGGMVTATDLRASVSLVLAGLAARGTTVVRDIYHLDRGYECLEKRLQACGAIIERIGDVW